MWVGGWVDVPRQPSSIGPIFLGDASSTMVRMSCCCVCGISPSPPLPLPLPLLSSAITLSLAAIKEFNTVSLVAIKESNPFCQGIEPLLRYRCRAHRHPHLAAVRDGGKQVPGARGPRGAHGPPCVVQDPRHLIVQNWYVETIGSSSYCSRLVRLSHW